MMHDVQYHSKRWKQLAATQRHEPASELNVRLAGAGIPASRVVCSLATVAVICVVLGP